MYLRNVKQYVKNSAPSFEERRYGFVNFLEAVRACGRAGLFRLERNRQGILRIFAGPQFPSGNGNVATQEGAAEAPAIYDVANDEVQGDEVEAAQAAPVLEEQAPVMDVEPVQEVMEEGTSEEESPAVPIRKRRPSPRAAAGTSTKKKAAAPRKTKKKAADESSE
jgi:hypothetical protein